MSFQPTFSEIREQVMMKLRLDPDDASMVDYWMKQAYADVAQHSGYEWSITNTTVVLTKDTGTFALPCDVAWLRFLRMRYGDGTVSNPAQQVRMEEVLTKQEFFGSAGVYTDGHVYAVAGQFDVAFWPLAAQGQRALIQHTVLPEELSDTEAPLIAEPFGSKLLEYGALVEGARFKKDPLLADFQGTYAVWMARYVAWLNRRKGGTSTAFEVWAGERVVDRIERESEHWARG